MKKKAYLAALAATCAFAFAAPAFAAPSTEIFADVPAKHWAYEAVYKLAKDGIVSGDAGRFMGDRTITRYEMAVMVANAMTKLEKADASQKALIDKLGKEFNDDLVKLGARMSAVESRVAKVEQKAKVNFFFDNRIQYNYTTLKPTDTGKALGGTGNIDQGGQFMERIRMYMNAQVGDSWQWDARLVQAKWNFSATGGTDTPRFDRFWVTNKNLLGGQLELGKMMLYPGKGSFYQATGDADGAYYTTTAGKATLRLGSAQTGGSAALSLPSTNVKFAELTYRPTKTSDIGAYVLNQDFSSTVNDMKLQVVNGAFEIPSTGGLALSFEYAKNKPSQSAYDQSGYFVALQSKYAATNYMPALYTSMVNPFKKGDHGWAISYRHLPSGVSGAANRGSFAWVPLTTDTDGSWQNNYNGVNSWRFDYLYVPWKNVQWTFSYDRSTPIDKAVLGDWTNNSFQSTFNFFF